MKQVRTPAILIACVLVLTATFSCSKKEPPENDGTEGKAMQGQTGAEYQDKNNKATKDNKSADKVKPGENKYVNQKYGFSLTYNRLMFDDKIAGDRFAELTHLSGDKAVVHIKEPDPLVGDDPEAWLMNSYKTSPYLIHRRKELRLGKYPARLVEFSWKVLGKPIRTIDLTAYKRAVARIILADTISSIYKNGKHSIYGVCHDELSI